MAKAAKKAAAKKATGKRETIVPKGDKRYVRRNAKGQIQESDDQGRSLSKDVKQKSKTKVKSWIVSDITEFKPSTGYDVWHDRATFNFLTQPIQIDKYLAIASQAINGYLTIGTFSNNGPTKCSGLNVNHYTEFQLENRFDRAFKKIICITEDHVTPFNTTQKFLFCSFKKVG